MKTISRALWLLICLSVCSAFGVQAAWAQSRLLNGTWQFAVDREGKWTVKDLDTVRDWREIQVPLSWNARNRPKRRIRPPVESIRPVRPRPDRPPTAASSLP